MSRLARLRLLVAPCLLLLVTAQSAMATHWEPGYQNYGRGSTTGCWVSGDRFTSFAYVRWTAAQADNLRATGRDNGNGNLRYTQDMRDANDNVDADGYWISNFDNPKYDNENDGGSSKREEAEMTAQSANFPTADKTYHFSARYSHHFGCDRNFFDGDAGYIGHNEHMSQQNWFGEWDTYNFAYSGTKFVWYPSSPSPWTSSVQSTESSQSTTDPLESVIDEAPTFDAPAQPAVELPAPASAPFRVVRDAGGVFVDPDFKGGLDHFRETMHSLGLERIARGDSIEVVVTFSHPVTAQDLAELTSLGGVITEVEAIGTDAEGDRASAGAPYEDGMWDELTAYAKESGVALSGVVSATVIVPDQRGFTSLVDDPRVYLVDASPQLARESAQLAGAPSVNDVYWYLHGWAPITDG